MSWRAGMVMTGRSGIGGSVASVGTAAHPGRADCGDHWRSGRGVVAAVGETMLNEEHTAAAEMAGEAGEVLLTMRDGSLTGKALGKEGDQRSHRLLMEPLSERFPGDGIRSEEADKSEA